MSVIGQVNLRPWNTLLALAAAVLVWSLRLLHFQTLQSMAQPVQATSLKRDHAQARVLLQIRAVLGQVQYLAALRASMLTRSPIFDKLVLLPRLNSTCCNRVERACVKSRFICTCL